MTPWTAQKGPTRFGSTELRSRWRDALLPALVRAHALDPFTPRHIRQGLSRAADVVKAIGLDAVMIRGTVAARGVEVDHVWLAVTAPDGRPWVLDPVFPLNDPSFTALLHGYVAGDVSVADLACVAEGIGMDARVIGQFPRDTGYRGEPVWAKQT